MGSEALELALAVYRTPIKRHALYDRALPRDISLVLQLASAPQPLLGEVAAELDESEQTIVEAVRFYLQLALFQPDADAYRVLGLSSDATHERIREHFRWLQRWLHPDRRGEDWEALFATRVNWAWSNLRKESARLAYDAQCELSPPQADSYADEDTPPGMPHSAEWHLIAGPGHRASVGARIVIGGLLAGCAALLYLALTRSDELPQGPVHQARSDASDDVPVPTSLRAKPPAPAAPQTQPLHPSAHDDDGAGQPAREPGETPAVALDPHGVVPLPAKAFEESAPDAHSMVATKAAAATEGHGTGRRAADADSRSSDAASAGPPAKRALAAPAGQAVERGSGGPPAAAPAPESSADSRSTIAPDATLAQPETGAHSGHDAGKGGERLATTDDALARIDLAHQRVKQLAAFFGTFDSRLPPIWNDVAGQASAEAQRGALHERAGRDPCDFVLDEPRWRMSADSAALSANYRLLKRHAVSESGRFSLSMVWRERMWLVTQVELRPTL